MAVKTKKKTVKKKTTKTVKRTTKKGIKKGDKIFFDRHAGHKIEIDKKTYHVIKAQDIVVVL